MKKNIFLIVITVAALVSCKKESQDPQVNPQLDSKVKTSISNSGTTSYQYDAAGRRTKVVFSNGGRTEYDYQNGIVNENNFNSAGVSIGIYKQELNSDGLAVKETLSTNPGYSRTRQYNSDKQLLKWTQVDGGTTITADFFYKDGNCDSIRYTNNGNWNYTERNTYYTDKLNVLGGHNFGVQHHGTGSKNLGKTTQNFFPNGSSSAVSTATYEFDPKGRVTKASYLFNGSTDNIYYTY